MVISGVIRPPPEIRAVADRTALYVAKNGRAFESRILNSAKGQTPKFAFLQNSSPFYAYYQDRIAFYQANGGKEEEEDEEKDNEKESADKKKPATKDDNVEKKKAGEEENRRVAIKKKAAVGAAIDPVAKALLTQRNKIAQIRAASLAAAAARKTATTRSEKVNDNEGVEEEAQAEEAPVLTSLSATSLEPPPALHFINIVAPAVLSVAQIETIQLVAQLTALDGKGGAFLQQLTFREWNNPTYAFCHPRSGHFAYFSALVDAYRRVLTLWTTATPTNSSDKNAFTILVVNQVVNKDKDDKVDEMANNVQKCLELAAYQVEYKRDLAHQRKMQQQDAAAGADTTPVAALVDWHDFVVVETIDFPADQQVVMLPPPPPPPPPLPEQETETGGKAAGDNDMNDSDDDEYDDAANDVDEEQIRVVPSYTPKVVSAAAAAQRAKEQMTMIDPISGKSVAIKDMPEHLRIQLLDPKWAQERKKFQDKQKESNLVSADTFADNVAKFAQARGMTSTRTTDQDLMNEPDSSNKMRLEDANRILRQQALHPSTSVGPSLPGTAGARGGSSFHHAAPVMDASLQPDLKRPRLDALQLPPPLHPSSSAAVPLPPPPPPPPAAAASAAAAPPLYPTTYVLAPPGFEAGLPPPPPPPPAGEDPFAAAVTSATTDADGVEEGGGTEGELLSEADFVASLPKPLVTLQIRIPNDQAQMAWNFYGQIVALESINVMSTVKAVKQELSRTHLNGMPANKIQLKLSSNNTFLKDSLTLAALNLGGPASSTTLELVPKTRGGRK